MAQGDAKAFPGARPLAAGRPVAIVWVFAALVAVLLGITMYGSHLLASGRAFVGAEALWSKAQKDATFYLTRYAHERTPRDLDEYDRAMRVIDGDRMARLEMTKPDPDLALVRRGLREGGVHATEVEGLLHLYRSFKDFGPMRYVLDLWVRTDIHVEALQHIAAELRSIDGLKDPQRAGQLVREIQNINLALKPLEDDFSQTLAEMQRTAESLFMGGILVITNMLLIGAIGVSRRFLDQNARLQQTLAESESQLRHLLEAAPMPLLIVAMGDQRLLYANEGALAQFALNVDSARLRSLGDFYADPEGRALVEETFSRAGSARNVEVRLKDTMGRESWMLLSAQPVRYEGAVRLLVALANIDDRKRLQEDMRRKAMHDPLTGLPNRAMFIESLERSVSKAKRRHARFSVLFIDLDRFKEVNDSMGHAAGDALLKTVAQRLGTAVRHSDIVARLGGDEFVILIEEHGGPEEVMIVAQKALDLLQRPVTIDWREAEVSGSIGISSYPEDGLDVETLLKNADAAMYQAKERGRNNFQFYSDELNRLSARRFEQEKRVRGALERSEFFLEYQPEIDLPSGRVVAVEALLRWRDPTSGVILPPEFMPLAEETGSAGPIGLWVLDQGMRDLAGWHRHGLEIKLAVNLSARQVLQHDLVDEMQRLLDLNGVAARYLRVEIKEPALLADSESVHRTIRALKGLGVEIAIDNFGSGYSSLGLLRGLPVSVVKIDRSLVSSCPMKRECAAIVQAATSMARVMGVRVVAEGVETAEQLEIITALGCDGAQGYFFARPLDAAHVAKLKDEAPKVTTTAA